MPRNQEKISAGGMIVTLLVVLSAIALERGLVSHPKWYKVAWITIPLLIISIVLHRKKML